MAAIDGKSVREGVATAMGAVLRAATGIGGVSPEILQHGVDALKKQLPPQDYPEVVAVCDTLETALATKIPGTNVIGIAAESGDVPEGAEPTVPCVVGVKGLLNAVSPGDILIVDGDKGAVQIDPDPKVLIAYQQREDAKTHGHALFIESGHIHAKTQAGDTVFVYARASDEAGLMTAVAEGADGLVVEPFEPFGRECYETTLRIALGKPTAILASSADKDLLRAAGRFAADDQVTVLFPATHFERLANRMAEALDHVAQELKPEDLEAPEVTLGMLAIADVDPAGLECETRFCLVDLRSLGRSRVRKSWVEKVVSRWSSRGTGRVAFDFGDRLDIVDRIVKAGARHVVTAPDMVAKTKNAIRTIGLEDVD